MGETATTRPQEEVTAADANAAQLPARTFWLAVAAVWAVQMYASVYLLRHSFFFADDFIYLDLFDDLPINGELLGRSIFGHMVPALILVQKAFGTWFGANWTAAALATLALQLGGSVAFVRLMTALHGRAWFVPLACAGFSCSVVMLNNVPWWSAVWTMGATVICAISAWGCATRYANTRQLRYLASMAVMFTLSVTFFEKSLALAAYIGLFVLFVGQRMEVESWGERIRYALRLWPVWAVMAVIGVVDLAFYFRGTYLDEAGPAAAAKVTAEYVARSLPEGAFTSLFGIAYPTVTLPGPDVLTPIAATVVLLAVIAWTGWRSALARRVWVWFLICAVVSHLLVARGRLGLMDVEQVVYMLRYQVDATYLLLVALSIAVPAAMHTTAARTARPARLLAVSAVAPLVLSLVWVPSVRGLSETSPGRAADAYFAPVRGDKAPERPFLELPMPEGVVGSTFYPWNMASHVLAQYPGVEVTTDPRGAIRIAEPGRIVPVRFDQLTAPSPRSCALPGQGEAIVLAAPEMVVPTSGPLMLVADFTSRGSSSVTLAASTPEGEVPVSGGSIHELAGRGRIALPLPGPIAQVRIAVQAGDKVCLRQARLATLR